jgi:hypothetical protein
MWLLNYVSISSWIYCQYCVTSKLKNCLQSGRNLFCNLTSNLINFTQTIATGTKQKRVEKERHMKVCTAII